MWIAKVMSVTTDQEGNEQLYVTSYSGNESLKACKKKKIGLVAFYNNMTAEEIYYDDATKKETRAEYQISKGLLGGILLYGRNHKKLCTIRENKEEQA